MLRFLETVQDIYEPPPHCVALTRYFYPPSERSDVILCNQLHKAERVVSRAVICPLQSHQREALLCLVSDIVAGLAASSAVSFEKSFLVTALNRGMFQICVGEFFNFVYFDGKVQTRLWEKRKAETFLFSRGKLLFE